MPKDFTETSYVARRNFWNFLGIKCRILSLAGTLIFFVKAKAFKLKEDITVFRDKEQTQPALNIKARSVIDFGATYDIEDVEAGEKVGALRRKGLKSLLRDEWLILDADENEIGMIQEDSKLLAFLRRFLSNLIPQNYTITVGGEQVGAYEGTWNPFIVKHTAKFNDDYAQRVDPRLLLAGSVLLMIIEGKQG